LRGTVYAPTANLNLKVADASTTLFSRGLIARRVLVSASGNSGPTNAPFQIPGIAGALPVGATPSTGRIVTLTASVGGRDRLRAQVVYDDSAGQPGSTVTVKSWTWL
ncbi:MAG TPA: hypothetical protein VGH94_04575, partial [Acidimicrobiales bacterium]